ncbi:MAG: transporter [Patescibacteria group bacterium]
MNKVILSLTVAVLLALVSVFADSLIKVSGAGVKFINWWVFIAGLVIYASTAFGWFFVMKNVKLSTLGVWYAVATVLALTFVSVFYFKESLNVYELVGIFLAIGSLILLSRFA